MNSANHTEMLTPEIRSTQFIYREGKPVRPKRWVAMLGVLGIVILFLPWTQHIRARGFVTTLRQEQRTQEVQAIIPGRVVKWFVKEGDRVQAGDTILQLGEIKPEYFDTLLLERTREQILAKERSAGGYMGKAGTADLQTLALQDAQSLKLQELDTKIRQQGLKIKSDSADLLAAENEVQVYTRQLSAARSLLDSGLISLSDFERRKLNYQQSLAKKTSASNKFQISRQEQDALKLEQLRTIQDYSEKIAKASGDRYSSVAGAASAEAELAKLKNQYASYDVRRQFYYITATQSGQIVQARKSGIGETVKEGEMIARIVPDSVQFAVEMYVDAMDLPLLNTGQTVRFAFDGFPAIVFSGWPESSFGTFGGVVSAIESSADASGRFRVLVIEDPKSKKWPANLRLGGGADGIALLKDVPVYYELWRTINGFPPDYYKKPEQKTKK